MSSPVLSLKDASLSLMGNAGRVDILHQITLDVNPGETLALIGPSGSGKSSLLMLMGGLEKASSGSVRALGQDLTTMNEDQLARFRRDNMGVVFQSFHLIPTMTALENVATPLELAGAKDAFTRAKPNLMLSASPIAQTTTPPNSRVGNSSAWPLLVPRRPVRAFFLPTNLPATSMPPMAPRSSTCSFRCVTATARRSSWSPIPPNSRPLRPRDPPPRWPDRGHEQRREAAE